MQVVVVVARSCHLSDGGELWTRGCEKTLTWLTPVAVISFSNSFT
jgi:hypothetical protein